MKKMKKMKKKLLSIFVLINMALVPRMAYAESYSPEGLWLTENERSAIRVQVTSDGSLEGYIAWIIDGGMQFDENNPDEALRERPMCGLEIMKGLTQQNNKNKWQGGHIYKADDGDVYDVNVEILDQETLKVRGYMGVTLFGKTQIWKRVSDDNYPKCKQGKK